MLIIIKKFNRINSISKYAKSVFCHYKNDDDDKTTTTIIQSLITTTPVNTGTINYYV